MATVDHHLKIKRVKRLAGFLAEDIGTEETEIKIVSRGFFHSDQKQFHVYVERISDAYLKSYPVANVDTFLIIVHRDSSADIYVDKIPIEIRVLGKRVIQEGEELGIKDIADIFDLRFKGIEIKGDDNVVFCFRKNWKFGLFFDFIQYSKNFALDVEALYQELGNGYKYLAFQEEYEVVRNQDIFDQIFGDGWLPFIQILGEDFRYLSSLYEKDKNIFVLLMDGFLDRFDKDRIDSFVSNWWRNQLFREKKPIIESGIEAYLAENFVSCIKTLYSEIEGIVRISYTKEEEKSPTFPMLIEYAGQKAKRKFVSMNSLGFPDIFSEYLEKVMFKGFNLQKGEVDLSRHSVGHGVAKAEDYTRMRALQAILVLDQLYFYLTSDIEQVLVRENMNINAKPGEALL